MNSPQQNSPSTKEPGVPDKGADSGSPDLTVTGLGLPHLSSKPAGHASDSSLEPDEKSTNVDTGVEADQAAAEDNDPASPAKT